MYMYIVFAINFLAITVFSLMIQAVHYMYTLPYEALIKGVELVLVKV